MDFCSLSLKNFIPKNSIFIKGKIIEFKPEQEYSGIVSKSCCALEGKYHIEIVIKHNSYVYCCFSSSPENKFVLKNGYNSLVLRVERSTDSLRCEILSTDTKNISLILFKVTKLNTFIGNISDNKKNILLVPDTPGWCFHNISLMIKKYLGHKYNIFIEFLNNKTCYSKYKNINLVVKFWYGTCKNDPFDFFPNAKKAICVYDYIYWNKKIGNNYLEVLPNLKRICFTSNYILYSCPAVKEALIYNIGNEILSKLHPIYDGYDTEKFYYKPYSNNKKLVVGWVGNKNNIYKRFKLLQSIIGNVEWIEFKIQDKKSLIPHDKMVEYYHSIDVLVCLSMAEGTPNPILEASGSGRTWISTNVGLCNLINDTVGVYKPGIIIEHESKLLDKLKYLYENRNIMEKMGKAAYERVKNHFSWNNQIKQFDNIFQLL